MVRRRVDGKYMKERPNAIVLVLAVGQIEVFVGDVKIYKCCDDTKND